ncbi:hypothetical protein ACFOHW_01280 [Paenibacillus abyssi]|uniref:hypothetical protein n=1 Tax=Paenibacillus abyssi TaxID=1340531 RepID=UPI0036204B71
MKKVQLTGSERFEKDGSEQLRINVRVDYEKYENDRYYEVPVAVRWKYGFAYGGLALFLLFMMWHIQTSGVVEPIR